MLKIKNFIQRKSKIILMLILLWGLFLRIYQLNKESIFRDEAFTIFYDNYSYFVTDTVYYILMHYWMKLFGTGEFAVRLPSAVFGILSIYIIFLLGRRLFDEKTSLLASYLFAVSTINIFHAQFSRPYSMAVLFVLLSFLFFFEALEKNTKPFWFGYIFFTLFALLSSASTIPILICQLLFVVLTWSRYKRHIKVGHLIAVFVIILVIYLPVLWALVMLNMENGRLVSVSWLSAPSVKNILENLNFFAGKIYYERVNNPINNPLNLTLINIFGITFFLLCLIGIFSAFRINKEKEKGGKEIQYPLSTLFLSLWLCVPIAVLFIFSYLFTPAFGPVRYVLYTSCAYYLLISQGIMFFEKRIRFLMTILIIVFGLLFLREYYQVDKGTNWRKIGGYIKENIKEDEKVVFIAVDFATFDMLLYYQVPSPIGLECDDEIATTRGRPTYERLKDRLRFFNKKLKSAEKQKAEDLYLSYKGVLFVASNIPSFGNLHSYIMKKIMEKYILVQEKNFCDASVYYFRIR